MQKEPTPVASAPAQATEASPAEPLAELSTEPSGSTRGRTAVNVFKPR